MNYDIIIHKVGGINLNIGDIQTLFNNKEVVLTQHFLDKIELRDIKILDIKQAIINGEIIENYPDDYPYPSALVLGFSDNKPLHIVAGIGSDLLWLITAYYPDSDIWEDNNRTRKVEEL